jgi:hypothetical protein
MFWNKNWNTGRALILAYFANAVARTHRRERRRETCVGNTEREIVAIGKSDHMTVHKILAKLMTIISL